MVLPTGMPTQFPQQFAQPPQGQLQAAPPNAAPGKSAMGVGIPFSADIIRNESEVLAVVMVDEIVNGDYGEQWHIGLRPLQYNMNTPTGLIQAWYPTDSISSRSKFGIALDACLKVFGPNYIPAVGVGHLVGTVCWWRRYEHEFGKDRTTRETIKAEMTVPLRLATEAEKAMTPPPSTNAMPIASAPAMAPQPQSLTPDDVLDVCMYMHSQTVGDAVGIAARADLPGHVKAGVMNGGLLDAIVGQGYLVVHEGRYYVSEQAGAALNARQAARQGQPQQASPPVQAAPPQPVAPSTAPPMQTAPVYAPSEPVAQPTGFPAQGGGNTFIPGLS